MNDLTPTIETILGCLFDAIREPERGVKHRRIRQVERLLREFLETDGERTLCSCNATLLAAEREWDAEGAFSRTMGGDELLAALPLFVIERAPVVEPLLRRVLAHCVLALTGMLVRDKLVSDDAQIDTLREIRDALDDVSRELERSEREKRRAARRQRREAESVSAGASAEAAIARSRQSAEQD